MLLLSLTPAHRHSVTPQAMCVPHTRTRTPCPCISPQEECRAWDISEVVFSQGMWGMYQPMLRGDFTLFDEYEFTGPQPGVQPPGRGDGLNGGGSGGGGSQQPPFEFPIHAFWGTRDRRVTREMVQVRAVASQSAYLLQHAPQLPSYLAVVHISRSCACIVQMVGGSNHAQLRP